MRALLSVFVLLVAGCGYTPSIGENGADVGGACSNDVSCDETCIAGSPLFPGGMCTWRCIADADCPTGTTCTDIKLTDSTGSGYTICGLPCATDANCFRSLKCSPVRHVGGDKQVNICWVAGSI